MKHPSDVQFPQIATVDGVGLGVMFDVVRVAVLIGTSVEPVPTDSNEVDVSMQVVSLRYEVVIATAAVVEVLIVTSEELVVASIVDVDVSMQVEVLTDEVEIVTSTDVLVIVVLVPSVSGVVVETVVVFPPVPLVEEFVPPQW